MEVGVAEAIAPWGKLAFLGDGISSRGISPGRGLREDLRYSNGRHSRRNNSLWTLGIALLLDSILFQEWEGRETKIRNGDIPID